MSSEDEAFNQFIVIDDGENDTQLLEDSDVDSDKENSTKELHSTKSKKTNQAQIDKIIAFVKGD